MYWLALIVFVLHVSEELPRFPVWATRHFGATSPAWYVYSHIALVVVVIAVCLWADNAAPQTLARVIGTALMITLALNGAFHVVTTLLFREYSPGVVTGTTLFFPATTYLLIVTVRDSLLTTTQTGLAVIIGAAVQVGVIGSLYLRMDIGWRFQRPSAAQQAVAADGASRRR